MEKWNSAGPGLQTCKLFPQSPQTARSKDIIVALYLMMLERRYFHPEQRMEIVTTRRKVTSSRLRSPLYWLKWLSVTIYFWMP